MSQITSVMKNFRSVPLKFYSTEDESMLQLKKRARTVKAKILVVDDEPDAVELIEFNLKASGFDVMVADDGREALQKATATMPDLILLDVMLPETDGLE